MAAFAGAQTSWYEQVLRALNMEDSLKNTSVKHCRVAALKAAKRVALKRRGPSF